MPSDYLPSQDAELVAWLTNFVTYANANLAALGLVAGDMTPITTNQTAFNTAFNNNITAQNNARNAAAAKDLARTNLELVVRTLVRKIQGTPTVTNAQRQSLGISERGTARTPVEIPKTRPVLTVDTSQRLQHTVAFADETTPTSKAKPDGVQGCEIWVFVGATPPADPKGYHFLAMDTKTPYVAHFEGADGGKTAHYMGRWVNTKGETGPWSEIVSATIVA
jgi:hypothetical protein